MVAVSARDMKTTGQAAPHRIPPKRHVAVYMIAFTVRLAERRLGKTSTSVAVRTSQNDHGNFCKEAHHERSAYPTCRTRCDWTSDGGQMCDASWNKTRERRRLWESSDLDVCYLSGRGSELGGRRATTVNSRAGRPA